MHKIELYSEYEKILIGKKKNFPSSFFDGNEQKQRENALEIMRYAFGTVLGWTPEEIANYLDKDMIQLMKLNALVRYLDIPEEFSSKIDGRYFAHLMYPRQISFSNEALALDVYKRVLSGDLYGFPKKYFHGERGVFRATVCLSYVMRNLLQFSSIQEVYEFFASPEGKRRLKELHLLTALDLFDTPIDFAHQSLAKSQQDDFLFNYNKFKYLYKQQKITT